MLPVLRCYAATTSNGDAWMLFSRSSAAKPITAQTSYALACLALDGITKTKTATVRILPTFQEL